MSNETSSKQAPIHSGFRHTTTAQEVLRGMDLRGKVAIVTGGYSGIGLETTRALAEKQMMRALRHAQPMNQSTNPRLRGQAVRRYCYPLIVASQSRDPQYAYRSRPAQPR